MLLLGNKPVVCALTASYISTFVGYPVCLTCLFGGNLSTGSFTVGFFEVEAADNQDTDASAQACWYRLPGRGGDRLL